LSKYAHIADAARFGKKIQSSQDPESKIVKKAVINLYAESMGELGIRAKSVTLYFSDGTYQDINIETIELLDPQNVFISHFEEDFMVAEFNMGHFAFRSPGDVSIEEASR